MRSILTNGIVLDTSRNPIVINNRSYKVRSENTITSTTSTTTTSTTTTGGGGGGTFIPVDSRDIYMDNSQQSTLTGLVDGNLLNNVVPVNNLNQLIYPNYDVVFNLDRYNCKISKIEIAFGSGAGGTTQTDVIIVKADGTEILLGTWTQNGYQQIDSFYYNPANHSEETPFFVSRVILRAHTNASYGAEVRFTGSYTTPAEAPKKARKPIGYMAGWNIHPWNLCYSDHHDTDPLKMAAFESMNLYNGSIRCYDDWYAVQNFNGEWRIGTEIRGFVMDKAYTQLKAVYPQMVKWRCLQNQSLYIQSTWDIASASNYMTITVQQYDDYGGWGSLRATVSSITGSLNNSTYYHIYSGGTKVDVADFVGGSMTAGQTAYFNVGGGKGYTVGQSLQFRRSQKSHVGVPFPADGNLVKDNYALYDLVGYAAFVYASRLGKNTSVPDYPVPAGDTENPMTKGTDLCDIFEFGNEWNAFWTGWNGFWNGRSFYYAWSMMYDGHKGAYANRGIKQADPNAKLATTGLASDKLDVIWGAYNEAKLRRGYHLNGLVDVPWDIVNFHCYSSAGGQYSGSEGGLPPEQGMLTQVKDHVWWVENYSPDSEIYISEWGWDANQGSPLAALTYGPYTNARQVAAMWHVRAMLLFAKEGLDRAQAYRLFQDYNSDDNNPTQFATMAGLRENSTTSFSRTAVGDYMKQIMEFGDYIYDSEITTGEPGVHCYRFKSDTNTIITLWSEEQTTIVSNKPQFTERTGSVAVPVPNNANLNIRTFVDDGSGLMATQNVTAVGTSYTVAYNSKPKVIQIL